MAGTSVTLGAARPCRRLPRLLVSCREEGRRKEEKEGTADGTRGRWWSVPAVCLVVFMVGEVESPHPRSCSSFSLTRAYKNMLGKSAFRDKHSASISDLSSFSSCICELVCHALVHNMSLTLGPAYQLISSLLISLCL